MAKQVPATDSAFWPHLSHLVAQLRKAAGDYLDGDRFYDVRKDLYRYLATWQLSGEGVYWLTPSTLPNMTDADAIAKLTDGEGPEHHID